MSQNPVESEVLANGGLRLELDGALATVVLDRPERCNALSNATFAALAAIPELLPPEVRVVLIRAEGAIFSAGLDLRLTKPEGIPGEKSLLDITAGDDASVQDWIGGIQKAFAWLREGSWITVAAVQGAAIGGGFQLALSADIRVLATDARFSMREIALGIVPDLLGSQNLSALVGYSGRWRSAPPPAGSTPRNRWRSGWPAPWWHPNNSPSVRWNCVPRCWRIRRLPSARSRGWCAVPTNGIRSGRPRWSARPKCPCCAR